MKNISYQPQHRATGCLLGSITSYQDAFNKEAFSNSKVSSSSIISLFIRNYICELTNGVKSEHDVVGLYVKENQSGQKRYVLLLGEQHIMPAQARETARLLEHLMPIKGTEGAKSLERGFINALLNLAAFKSNDKSKVPSPISTRMLELRIQEVAKNIADSWIKNGRLPTYDEVKSFRIGSNRNSQTIREIAENTISRQTYGRPDFPLSTVESMENEIILAAFSKVRYQHFESKGASLLPIYGQPHESVRSKTFWMEKSTSPIWNELHFISGVITFGRALFGDTSRVLKSISNFSAVAANFVAKSIFAVTHGRDLHMAESINQSFEEANIEDMLVHVGMGHVKGIGERLSELGWAKVVTFTGDSSASFSGGQQDNYEVFCTKLATGRGSYIPHLEELIASSMPDLFDDYAWDLASRGEWLRILNLGGRVNERFGHNISDRLIPLFFESLKSQTQKSIIPLLNSIVDSADWLTYRVIRDERISDKFKEVGALFASEGDERIFELQSMLFLLGFPYALYHSNEVQDGLCKWGVCLLKSGSLSSFIDNAFKLKEYGICGDYLFAYNEDVQRGIVSASSQLVQEDKIEEFIMFAQSTKDQGLRSELLFAYDDDFQKLIYEKLSEQIQDKTYSSLLERLDHLGLLSYRTVRELSSIRQTVE